MKMRIVTVVAVSLAVLIVSCKQESAPTNSKDLGVVAFDGAGVSLEPGTGWQRIDVNPGPPVCPPTLVGASGIVRAMIFAPGLSDVKTAASNLRAVFDSNTKASKDSFRQDEFIAESGLSGLHLSYAEKTEKDGKVTETHSHNYIVTNRQGRCVSISYLATGASDSELVHQMVRKSLKLQ